MEVEGRENEPLEQRIKELEISDDEEVCTLPSSPSVHLDGDDYDEQTTIYHKVAWDSSDLRKASKPPLHAFQYTLDPHATEIKDKGNEAYRQGKVHEAISFYSQALAYVCDAKAEIKGDVNCNDNKAHFKAALYSNIAAAYLRLNEPARATEVAKRAASLSPHWTKPLYRLAQAQIQCREYKRAVITCLRGEKLASNVCTSTDSRTEFSSLLDEIAVKGGMEQSDVGFTGSQLEVRSAGEDAWLGRPAPHIPALDGPLTEETALPSDDLSVAMDTHDADKKAITSDNRLIISAQSMHGAKQTDGKMADAQDGFMAWHRPSDSYLSLHRQQRTSFRCLKEAMDAAKDGDRILLLRGTHNGMGHSVEVKKRVLIVGQGSLGETVIDQRANCPTLRILHSGVVVRNIEFDHTGFRECIKADINGRIPCLIDNCIIKCSGDDGVNVGGTSTDMILRNCVLHAKKCGVRTFDKSTVTLEGCIVEKCGEQGVKAMEKSTLKASLTVLRDNEEEGAVVMQSANLSLLACTITGNKAAGVDCSDEGCADIQGGEISGNVGGIFLWDNSSVVLDGVRLHGGRAPVILVDGNSRPLVTSCVIKGTVHASDQAWKGILGDDKKNRMEDPDQPTDFPPEEGPFKFVPNKYTRKQ